MSVRYFSWLMAAAVAAVLISSLAVQAEDAKPAAPAGEEFKIESHLTFIFFRFIYIKFTCF